MRTDENEVADIKMHLRAFLANPPAFAAMGERGRKELEEKHAPEPYAQTVVELAARPQAFRPRAAALKLADRAGVLMSEWLGPNPNSETCHDIAREILNLAGE